MPRLRGLAISPLPCIMRPMEKPPPDLVAEMTSFLESLRLGSLWSDNGLTAWATLLVGIFVGLTAGRIVAWLLARLAQRCETRGWAGRAAVLSSLSGPASLAILTIGLTLGLVDLRMDVEVLQPFVFKTLLLLYTIAVFWYAYNLVDVIDVLVRRLARGVDSSLQRQIVLLLSRSLRVFLVVVGTLFVAQSVFDQDIGAWLAGLGIAGLAVSLAAQDSLKHLFGSITILLDRSFRIGDSVVSSKIEGTIEDIGFRSTKVRTPAGCLVTIPNSNLVNNPIENLSRRPAIRRVVTLLIAGRTPSGKLRQALSAIADMFDEEGIRGPVHPVIDGVERRPQVFLEDIQGGDFKVTVTYWYAPPTDPEYAAHASRVNLRLAEELQKAGVELSLATLRGYACACPG